MTMTLDFDQFHHDLETRAHERMKPAVLEELADETDRCGRDVEFVVTL